MTLLTRPLFHRLLPLAAAGALAGCETLEGDRSPPGSGGTVTVQGTLFYPDAADTTYIIPEGAQIIGAGGRNCRFVVQSGGSLTVHTGENNVYQIASGGHFRGFAHPAKNCTVTYQPGAILEIEETGPGTSFEAL